MPSPVRQDLHDNQNCIMIALMAIYSARMREVMPISSATLKLGSRNEVQPDFGLRREDGSTKIENGYIVGPVELVGEISASSVARETTSKFEVYEASGFKECMIWETERNNLTWYKLAFGKYEEIVPIDGILKSEQFPGLQTDMHALLTNNIQRAMDRLNSAIDIVVK